MFAMFLRARALKFKIRPAGTNAKANYNRPVRRFKHCYGFRDKASGWMYRRKTLVSNFYMDTRCTGFREEIGKKKIIIKKILCVCIYIFILYCLLVY